MSIAAPATELTTDVEFLETIARRVGTPFWLVEEKVLRRHMEEVLCLVEGEGYQARFAMKSNPATAILWRMREAGVWIDAVSVNECRRALRAGYAAGARPPEILFTADVFRDDWKEVVCGQGILPNLGSPGMIQDLQEAGYVGPVALRVNVGFGHGHVNTCDTGGPSSKHGIWWEDLAEVKGMAARAGYPIVLLHSHVGSGPQQEELRENLARIGTLFREWIGEFPDVDAVSLGGGLPWDYRGETRLDTVALRGVLERVREGVVDAAGRPVRLEIEPGRYFVVAASTLVTRVTDVKATRTNAKGEGMRFAMVDAGFVDLVRPAMYGSYHRITIPARVGGVHEPLCVAGPLCESGDVFTRGADELLEPRLLPRPERGDLLCLHDGGAYGYAMASSYNSVGRAPQVWVGVSGEVKVISRRERLEDLLRLEEETVL